MSQHITATTHRTLPSCVQPTIIPTDNAIIIHHATASPPCYFSFTVFYVPFRFVFSCTWAPAASTLSSIGAKCSKLNRSVCQRSGQSSYWTSHRERNKTRSSITPHDDKATAALTRRSWVREVRGRLFPVKAFFSSRLVVTAHCDKFRPLHAHSGHGN